MSNEKNSGSELQKPDLSPSELNSNASCDLRAWVAIELQVMKELVPAKEMSDEAARAMLDMAVDAAAQVGQERFHAALVQAMSLAGQFRPTIGTIRRCCGLVPRLDAKQESVVAAWDLVSRVLTRHIGRDGHGNVVLQSFLQSEGVEHRVVSVPEIPPGVKDAVRMMGGWSALSDSWPAYAGQRWTMFKECYRGEPVTALVVNV
jgi:hypothetical protein